MPDSEQAYPLPERGSLRSRSVAVDQVHVFQALPRLTPEAAPAMRQIAAFIANSLCEDNIGQVG